jgi:hypothetical protein
VANRRPRRNSDLLPEVRRVADLLGKVAALSNRSLRSIEQQLGWGAGHLGQIVRGEKSLLLVHILEVLGALGIAPGEFFELAYPPKLPRASRLGKADLRQALNKDQPPLDPGFLASLGEAFLLAAGSLPQVKADIETTSEPEETGHEEQKR